MLRLILHGRQLQATGAAGAVRGSPASNCALSSGHALLPGTGLGRACEVGAPQLGLVELLLREALAREVLVRQRRAEACTAPRPGLPGPGWQGTLALSDATWPQMRAMAAAAPALPGVQRTSSTGDCDGRWRNCCDRSCQQRWEDSCEPTLQVASVTLLHCGTRHTASEVGQLDGLACCWRDQLRCEAGRPGAPLPAGLSSSLPASSWVPARLGKRQRCVFCSCVPARGAGQRSSGGGSAPA